MRQLLLVVLLLAGCSGGGVDAPEVSIDDVSWDGDTITAEVSSNLPDGAVLSWDAVAGGDYDDLDAEATSGLAEVEQGAATVTADVGAFEDDTAVVDVGFLAIYEGQPDGVAEAYGPPFTERGWPADWKSRASDQVTVDR